MLCTVPAARCEGRSVTTLEGVQAQAEEFGAFLADQGGEQCGSDPGFIMNAGHGAGNFRIPLWRRSTNTWRVTCADAPAM